MDTKWKKFKAFLGWTARLCVLFWILMAVYMTMHIGGSFWNALADVFQNKPQEDTHWFRSQSQNIFNEMIQEVTKSGDYDDQRPYTYWFDDQANNILYYAKNKVTGVSIGNFTPVVTNVHADDVYKLKIVLSDGNARMYVNGKELLVSIYALPRTIYSERVYMSDGGYYTESVGEYTLEDVEAVLWVRAPLDMSKSDSGLVWAARQANYDRIFIFILLGVSAVLLLLATVFFKHKKNADIAIGKVTRHIWLEFKLGTAFACFLMMTVGIQSSNEATVLMMIFPCAVLYILWSDLLVNKSRVFTHNSIHSIIRAWRRHINSKPFQKGMMLELYITVGIEVVSVFFGSLFFAAAANSDEMFAWLCLFAIIAGGLVAWRFIRRYRHMVGDLGRVIDHVAEMNRGRFEDELSVPDYAVLYPVATSINGIQSTFSNALQKATKSERMKVELITNVSHDLKTPLTSIISYVELLSQMELPDEAAEHVEILSQKSERLKLLIQDLFDLSKSTSGSMELNLEILDFARLTEQTLSDSGCGDEFKIKLSDRPLWICADGVKLSRVLQNLIDNAKKYSLTGTRVYVDTFREGEQAVLEIKNIANYEMDFMADEVSERFVRGDASRSTDGSGLGLSIARSFTESMGGTFNLTIDGDMFKVRLSFESALPPEPRD